MSLHRGIIRSFVEKNKNNKDPSEFNLTGKPDGGTPPAACEGSITVEAALILPVFMMVFALFLSFFNVLQIQIKEHYSADTVLQKAAVFAGALRDGDDYKNTALADMDISVAGHIIKTENDDVTVNIPYYKKSLFAPAFSEDISFRESVCRRVWSGRVITDGNDSGEEDVYVFVAENGIVYHRSEGCSHLKLSIKAVSASQAREERNGSGGKYYPCEKCGDGGQAVYIAKEGNRYHTSRDCSGLKRKYSKVKLSETKLPPCTRCGG